MSRKISKVKQGLLLLCCLVAASESDGLETAISNHNHLE